MGRPNPSNNGGGRGAEWCYFELENVVEELEFHQVEMMAA